MTDPLVTIVTATFNAAGSIAEAARSVASQSFDRLEHILIDNVSSDRTVEIARDIYACDPQRLRVFVEPDRGISDAFNKGIQRARGDVIAFLHADDRYLRDDVVAEAMQALSDSDVMYVHGDMLFEDPRYGTNRRRPLLCSLEQAMPYNHPTMFVRADLYRRHGLYSLDYRLAMDFHFVCRLYAAPDRPLYRSVYLRGEPMVLMRAGGVSWQNESGTLVEVERALREFGFYGFRARRSLAARRLRILLRSRLDRLGLNAVTRLWRRFKWRT